MKPTLYLAAASILAGCATAQPPADLAAIHQSVLQRITYQNYQAKDWRYIEPGTTGAGNCAVFAWTSKVDLAKAGHDSQLTACHTPRGTPHVYNRVGEWALDNRFTTPILAATQDCR